MIQGQSATFHLQVSALGVFGQNGEQVSFLCPNNFPCRNDLHLSPARRPSAWAAGATAPFSITFTTSSNNVHSRVPPGFPARPGPPTTPWYIGAGALAALLFGLARSRRRGVLIGPAALAAVAIFVGCHHATITSNATPGRRRSP